MTRPVNPLNAGIEQHGDICTPGRNQGAIAVQRLKAKLTRGARKIGG